MEGTRQRCECTLALEEAIQGDLPGVCVWCGEATNQFPPTSLRYKGRRVRLCLPACSLHKTRIGQDSWPFIALVLGVSLFALGLGLLMPLTCADALQGGVLRAALFFASLGAILLGLLAIAAALAIYAVLVARDIAMGRFFELGALGVRIGSLGHRDVTLIHVAPEFVEALRVYRNEGQEVLHTKRALERPAAAAGEFPLLSPPTADEAPHPSAKPESRGAGGEPAG